MKIKDSTPWWEKIHWSENPCYGCGQPVPTTNACDRLCVDCRMEVAVNLAKILDPTAKVLPVGNIPRSGKVVVTAQEVDALIAKWNTEPGFDDRPAGTAWPWAEVIEALFPIQLCWVDENDTKVIHSYEINPVKLATLFAIEEQKALRGEKKKRR